MSRDALNQVTLALQHLLHSALNEPGTQPNDRVFVGPPAPPPRGPTTQPISLFLFHLEPNREMRNTDRRINTGGSDPVEQTAIPLDLRYLVSVHRQGGALAPNELLALGRVIAALQATPTIGGGLVPDQEIRITPEPYPMEEMSRIWSLFPQSSYATSMVYLATPVFVDARDVLRGPPVESRRLDSGTSTANPDVFGAARNGLQQGLSG